MQDFEILDEKQNSSEISEELKRVSKPLAYWIKGLVIVSLCSQGISFIFGFLTPNKPIIGLILGTGISIAFYITLLNHSKSLAEFSNEGSMSSFADAMLKQKLYWRFFGIILILLLISAVVLGAISVNDPRAFNALIQQFV